MAKTISCLAYSDIHHGEYTNGLTEEDVLMLEDEVLEHAQALGVDFIIFGGDRFISHNPPSHTRAAADTKLATAARMYPTIAVVGNHCRETKNSHSAHSMMHLPTLIPDSALVVLDEAGIYQPNHAAMRDIEFHVIPAGQRGAWRIPTGRQSSRPFCVALFHDILRGSLLANGHEAEHGLDPQVIDQPFYDIVLGGDNHVYQQLRLHNTVGYYIGAPCQHNWGDMGQQRGFLYITLEQGHVPKVTHIASQAPKFISTTYKLRPEDNNTNIVSILRNMHNEWQGNIIRITLDGDLKSCARINLSTTQETLRSTTGARRVTVVTDPIITYTMAIPRLACVQPPEDDWAAYIDSGKLDLHGCDPDLIKSMGNQILAEVHEKA